MSKILDFTKTGGLPLTQDQLAFMQQSYIEQIEQLTGGFGNNQAVRMSGMTTSVSGGGIVVAPGWFAYKNHLVRFPGNAYGASPIGSGPFMVITKNSAALPYNDGTSKNVVNEYIGTVVIMPGSTPTDDTHFPFGNMVSYGQALGSLYREQTFTHIVASTTAGNGTCSGDVYYKKDTISNTLQIRGVIHANTPADFAAYPAVSSLAVCQLPAAYWPLTTPSITLQQPVGLAAIKDSNGGYFTRLSGILDTAGNLSIGFIKPDAAVGAYQMMFSVVLPLD